MKQNIRIFCLIFSGGGLINGFGGNDPRFRGLIDQPTRRMSALYFDCLLGLPETSDAFSAHPKIVNISKNKGSEQSPSAHPRKTPRLTKDEDSATASRSRGVGVPPASRNVGNATRGDDDVVMGGTGDEDVFFVFKVEGAPCGSLPIHYFVTHPQHLCHSRQIHAPSRAIHHGML